MFMINDKRVKMDFVNKTASAETIFSIALICQVCVLSAYL